jgi:ACS family hexuronate transporter-like MFS transporter
MSHSRNRRRAPTLIGLLLCATAINYLDRQTLSIVAPLLRIQLGLSPLHYSRVIFLFLLGYMFGQTLAGRLIDRIGARAGMLFYVGFWSAVTMGHSFAAGVVSLGALRFLLGLAESGNWPGGVKAVSENVPLERRAFAIGVFNSGSTLGALIAPPLVALVVKYCGWRAMFALVGTLGFIWVAFWRWLYHPQRQAEGGGAVGEAPPRPVSRYIRDRAVWGVVVARFFADPTWWFYAFWLPAYLAERRGFSLMEIGKTAWIPFALAGVGGWCGGYASDWLVRHGMATVKARKVVMLASAALMLSGIPAFRVESSALCLACVSVVLFAYTSWASNILSLPADLFASGEVASITGIAGTAAAMGGMLYTLATGWLAQAGSYGSVFMLGCGMIVCAAVALVTLVPQGECMKGNVCTTHQ